MSDPSVKANIIGMFLEGIAYGIYFSVFLQTLRILRRKAVPGFVFVYLATTTFVLFTLITVTLVVDLRIAVTKLIGDTEDGTRIVSELAMLSCGAYVALTSIADIFIVYRVFAVWSRNSIISAIPCSLSIAGIISGGFLVANSGKYGFNEPRHLFTAFYCITLVLNVLSTALIASKLYISERQIKFSSSLKLKWTSVIVVESAALYSSCIVVVVICNVMGADDAHLVLLMVVCRISSLLCDQSNITAYQQTPSIIGLAFSLIIVRVAASGGRSNKTFTSVDHSGPGSVLHFARQPRTVNGTESGMDTCSSGPSIEKVSVATIAVNATVQLNSSPCHVSPAADIENQLAEKVRVNEGSGRWTRLSPST
ncbi:hypothetical protein PM082_014082 [Marasmius tenuissimus]|nr:hypothetical protein PM082_014082 [Marasmius tenuissimus]